MANTFQPSPASSSEAEVRRIERRTDRLFKVLIVVALAMFTVLLMAILIRAGVP